jgi:S-formylglutathione hydrolase FrmB
MALITCDFFSASLRMGTSMTVVLPELERELDDGEVAVERPADPPVLFLLHGLSDDHTAWLRWTSAVRYAEQAGLALVMPAVARSFYADEAHGHRYWEFVSEELPAVTRDFFGLTQHPTSTYVAGLSMGGYGAMKLALRHPERFAAAASFSGVLDLARTLDRPDREEVKDRVFGGALQPGDDLLAMLDQDSLPRLWVGCGTEDRLHPGNVTFVERARAAGHDVTVDFRPGDHTWDLWDTFLGLAVPWMSDRLSSSEVAGG